MSANPRSARLVAAIISGPSSYSPTFTCPAGMTVVVKHGMMFNNASGPGVTSIIVRTADGAVTATAKRFDLQPGFGDQVTMDVVLLPGDQIFAFANAFPTSVWISGMVMQGTAPITPAELSTPLQLPIPEPDVPYSDTFPPTAGA